MERQMAATRPPEVSVRYHDLPTDANERHEAFVDIFGEYLLWLRNTSVRLTHELVESVDARQQLGTIKREKYETVAQLDEANRAATCRMAEATVDRFARLLLTLLSSTGTDQRMESGHAIRFRLEMEVCDGETGDVIDEETINRGGKKFLPDYFGRWLNRYGAA